jgi:hypothetical protein
MNILYPIVGCKSYTLHSNMYVSQKEKSRSCQENWFRIFKVIKSEVSLQQSEILRVSSDSM